MINLLFNYTAKNSKKPVLMTREPSIVEVILFEANPSYSKKEVEKALISFNEIIKVHSGFIERKIANTKDGKYIDILYWNDMNSAKRAGDIINKDPKANELFKVVKQESIQIFHFDTFNSFEA